LKWRQWRKANGYRENIIIMASGASNKASRSNRHLAARALCSLIALARKSARAIAFWRYRAARSGACLSRRVALARRRRRRLENSGS
jgi:hypothetical protein